jgi:hypothetical protein
MSYSRKIKLNSRSSTKTELITSDMYMPEMLWSLYFIQSQGYKPECVGLHQDNISTQLLIKMATSPAERRQSTSRQSSSDKKKIEFDGIGSGGVCHLLIPTCDLCHLLIHTCDLYLVRF